MDDFDSYADELEADIKVALVAAYDRIQDATDIDALADAIAAQNDAAIAAILNLDEGLQLGLDNALSGAFLMILLGGFVISMKRFATRYGSRVDTMSEASRIRSDLRRNVVEPLARRSSETILQTITLMTGQGFDAETIARAVRSNLGLAPDQARSVVYFERALKEAMESPKRTTTGNITTIPADTAKNIRRRHEKYLNAAQRSVLAKTLSGDMTPDGLNRLVERHAKALTTYRQATIARQESTRIINAGEYLAFRQGRQNRSLSKNMRRFWVTRGDERVRHSHRTVPGMNAEGVDMGQPFQTPFGPVMYPPLEVNCRCRVVVRERLIAA